MSGGINFDTTSLGGGGNYGGYGGYYGGRCDTNIYDILALEAIGDRHRGHHDGGKDCCPPATCKDVNDVDRDVLKCSFDATEAMHEEARTIDRDILMGDKCIEQKICDSTHKLEKDIFAVDKDLLLGLCDTNRHIDKVETQLAKESAEIKGLIKETALCQENKELSRENAKLHDKLTKQDIISEILCAIKK